MTINSRELKRFPLFVPDPDEQKEMVALLSAADAQVEAVRKEIVALDRLKRSLLQNLLTGRVRVRVEPSAVARERIPALPIKSPLKRTRRGF
jgi:type I restriction enzyme S subunit